MKRYSRIISFSFALLTALVLSVSAFAADLACEGVVLNSIANVRSGPGSSYDLLGTIYQGEDVSILGLENKWYKIVYNDGIGYVFASYVEVFSHNFSTRGVASTCLEQGYSQNYCTVCGYEEDKVILPLADHDLFVSDTIAYPPCTIDIYRTSTCRICGWNDEVLIERAPGHLLSIGYRGPDFGTPFSCETGGYKISVCTREMCTHIVSEFIPAGHDYHEVSLIKPTYHSSGTQTMECTYCGDRKYITLPVLVDDGMSDDFFFTGSNVHDWRLEFVRSLRPRFWLHFWRYVSGYNPLFYFAFTC